MAHLVAERVGQLFVGGDRLEYTEYGGGDHWVVLVPAQLATRGTQASRARVLAGAGHHVVTVDPLGHGRSDRSEDPRDYSMQELARQVVALVDHLGADQAVVGGTSFGANVALEVAVLAPDRVRGLLLEAPVLDNALEAAVVSLSPLLLVARVAPWSVTLTGLLSRLVPRRLVPHWAGVALDGLAQRPAPLRATIHGLLFGRLAPPSRERRQITAPALVVGHPCDPLHLTADARMLAEELADATYVEAAGAWEWRLRPARLDAAMLDFVDSLGEHDDPPTSRLAHGS